MRLGKVKWFNRHKKYGFIIADDGNEYFVHARNIVMDGQAVLSAGENVNFEIKKAEDDRIEAFNVSSLDI